MHLMIHTHVSNVPTPRPINASEALKQLRLLEKYNAIKEADDIEKRLKVLIALFDEVEPDTTSALRRQLAIVCDYDKPS